MPEIETLLVISHVLHYRHHGRLFAYGPYAREIDLWADLFPRVRIASPCRDEPPQGDCEPFSRSNIAILPQLETGGTTARAKFAQLRSLPRLAWGLMKEIRRADAIHVRCPGNLGLLGAILGPIGSRRVVAKYAGQWDGYAGEPASVRLQRVILGSRWWRGPVTVYGEWPGQASHIVPFFTSMMSAAMVEHASRVATSRSRPESRPLRVLFSGRLEAAKRVDALLDAVAHLADRGRPVELAIVGGGSEDSALRCRADAHRLGDSARFIGPLRYADALAWNEWADCLVLPSTHSEGWPKVIAEAMCYGVACIAVDHGQVGRMLRGRGILLERGTAEEIADAIDGVRELSANRSRAISQDASRWASRYSLEGLRGSLRDLLEERWRVPLCMTIQPA